MELCPALQPRGSLPNPLNLCHVENSWRIGSWGISLPQEIFFFKVRNHWHIALSRALHTVGSRAYAGMNSSNGNPFVIQKVIQISFWEHGFQLWQPSVSSSAYPKVKVWKVICPSIYLSVFRHIHHKTYLYVFTLGLFIIAKGWKPSRCPSLTEWIIHCRISHNRIVQGHYNEQSTTVDNDLDISH